MCQECAETASRMSKTLSDFQEQMVRTIVRKPCIINSSCSNELNINKKHKQAMGSSFSTGEESWWRMRLLVHKYSRLAQERAAARDSGVLFVWLIFS